MLFQEAKNQSAYLKAGLFGFSGAGKTKTATKIAIGLHKYIQSDKPVFFLDTETGSDYVQGDFKQAGIKLMVSKSRAFVDLLQAVKEAEAHQAILIIDSVSHFWIELMESFKKQKGIDRILLHHWMPLKETWRQFSYAYVNSRCHIIMCGRAGWEFDRELDEEGVSELIKTGTKMKAETEIGFEPSLLIEMERVRTEKGKIGATYKRRAWIIKDRFGVIDGQYFDNPNFEDFLPHISRLNIGGEHVGVDDTNSSKELFDNNVNPYYIKKQKEILMEELGNELTLQFNGTNADKKARLQLLEEIFGITSKAAIEGMPLKLLKEGLEKVKARRIKKQEGGKTKGEKEEAKKENPKTKKGE